MKQDDIARFRDEWPQYWSEDLAAADDPVVSPLDRLFHDLDGLNRMIARDGRSAWVALRYEHADGRWSVYARPLTAPKGWTAEQALHLLMALDRFNAGIHKTVRHDHESGITAEKVARYPERYRWPTDGDL